ncbi:hypothetical protein SEA_ZIKO_92 [Gordonia phage Ziko]|uniref:Uncharacterized protein n=1 Tax=Gordonia phage Ziko TaxID=2591193 RepID=A0A514A586_9CAUD|nr:hypothetical protein SEA_ZIKO_92 [Gordonia phage Ziko]
MIINEFRCDRCKIAGYKENSLDEGPRGWFILSLNSTAKDLFKHRNVNEVHLCGECAPGFFSRLEAYLS